MRVRGESDAEGKRWDVRDESDCEGERWDVRDESDSEGERWDVRNESNGEAERWVTVKVRGESDSEGESDGEDERWWRSDRSPFVVMKSTASCSPLVPHVLEKMVLNFCSKIQFEIKKTIDSLVQVKKEQCIYLHS
jgi:hypothetical protein